MAIIPPAIQAPGAPRTQQSIIEQLLLGAAGTAINAGLQRLIGGPQQDTPQQQVLDAQRDFASQQLRGVPGSLEQQALQASTQQGLGNAAVPTPDVGLRQLESVKATAPLRLAQLQDEQAKQEALDLRNSLRTDILARVRADNPDLAGVAEMVLNAEELGAASALAPIIEASLPPDQLALINEQKATVELERSKALLRQSLGEEQVNAQIAASMGFPEGRVPTAVVTDLLKADSPEDLAERVVTSLMTRVVVDFTGNPIPAFTPEEGALRAQETLNLINTLTGKPEIAAIDPAIVDRGALVQMLSVALGAIRRNDPNIKDSKLREQLRAFIEADRGLSITDQDFEELFQRALRGNDLAGFRSPGG